MSWEEEHEQCFERMPADVREAHKHSIHHRAEILASQVCGCFHCCSTFRATAITEWTDDDDAGMGQTARCPKCGIDSVLGDKSGFEPSVEFLTGMRDAWF
jgi:hypothetical protein